MTSKTSFSCGEQMGIAQVASLHQRLLKAIQKSTQIELKADRVSKADTAGLQLFVALKKDIDEAGGKISWKHPSDALLDAAKLLGLLKVLELDTADTQSN